jgi:hypothetical protein
MGAEAFDKPWPFHLPPLSEGAGTSLGDVELAIMYPK